MPSGVFYWVLNMSIVTSFAGVVILAIRAIKKIPRRIIVILWAIPLIRMLIPVGIGGKYGLMNLLSLLPVKTVTVLETDSGVKLTEMNYIGAAKDYFPLTYNNEPLETVFSVSTIIWLTVAAAFAIAIIMLYRTTLHEIKTATRLFDSVYTSENVTSPAVYGIIRPRIVIPASAPREELDYSLLHEKCHIKRKDNLWRIIAFAVTIVHWFNPFAWIFLKCFLADVEVACDESVLQSLNDNERRKYALSLISGAESKTVLISAFGGAKIKTRIERILSFKKMSIASGVIFAAMIAAVAYILLTNAA